MGVNPWDTAGGNVTAQFQPMSPILGSGYEFGVITNPGADCIYIENPLYVPINLVPGPEFGQASPPAIGTLQPGIIVPAYSWASFPIGAANQLLFDARLFHSVSNVRGTVGAGITSRSPFYLANADPTAALQYPAGILPAPRMARYWFYDSQSPSISKGSLFRGTPIAYPINLGNTQFVTSHDRNAYFYCSAANTGQPLAGVWTPANQFVGATFPINGFVDRMCIVGAHWYYANVPTPGGSIGAGNYLGSKGAIWFMDESISGTRIYPDMVWTPDLSTTLPPGNSPNGNNMMGNYSRPGSYFMPVPGARGVCLMTFGNSGVPAIDTADVTLTLYLSEF